MSVMPKIDPSGDWGAWNKALTQSDIRSFQ